MTVLEITQWQELPHFALYKTGAAVPEFFSLLLYGGDLTASPTSQLEKAPDIHRTEGLLGRRAGLETDKSYCLCQDSNSSTSGVQAAVGLRYAYLNTCTVFRSL